MIVETIIKKDDKVTVRSIEIAEKFKDKVSPEQLKIIRHNVYTIEDGKDADEYGMRIKYRGCGSGWCEIDPHGTFVDLKYFDTSITKRKEVDNKKAFYYAEDEYDLEQLFTNGTDFPNFWFFNFAHIDELEPYILSNGNIRLFVNMRTMQLLRFTP